MMTGHKMNEHLMNMRKSELELISSERSQPEILLEFNSPTKTIIPSPHQLLTLYNAGQYDNI